MSVVNDLFQQIVYSEERIKQRYEELRKVNNKIQEYQERIRQAKFESQSVDGTLTVVRKKHVQVQIEEKWLQMRYRILLEQEKRTREEVEDLKKELANVDRERECKRSSFLEKCEAFLLHYDIARTGYTEYEGALNNEISNLKKAKDELQRAIQQATIENEKIEALKIRKDEAQKQNKQIQEESTVLASSLARMRDENEKLVSVKEEALKRSSQDTEFLKLQSDVMKYKNEAANLKDEHQQMATELYKLQQSYKQTQYKKNTISTRPSTHWNIAKRQSSTSASALLSSPPSSSATTSNSKVPRKTNDIVECISDDDFESFDFEFSQQLPDVNSSHNFNERRDVLPSTQINYARNTTDKISTNSQPKKFPYTRHNKHPI